MHSTVDVEGWAVISLVSPPAAEYVHTRYAANQLVHVQDAKTNQTWKVIAVYILLTRRELSKRSMSRYCESECCRKKVDMMTPLCQRKSEL